MVSRIYNIFHRKRQIVRSFSTCFIQIPNTTRRTESFKSFLAGTTAITSLALAIYTRKSRDCDCEGQSVTSAEKLTGEIDTLRPDAATFERIDQKLLETDFKNFVKDNAFHDTLRGESLVSVYEVYKHRESNEVWAVLRFGKSLNGHPGIVHGGIISTAFDNTYGWLFFSMKTRPAFTANLNINFRKPLYANSTVVIKAKLEEHTGRKLFMNAIMENSKGDIIADSTTLFITIPTPQDMFMKWFKNFSKGFWW
jgi:acyl-coenzyme A thioesterase PaaI-like protein